MLTSILASALALAAQSLPRVPRPIAPAPVPAAKAVGAPELAGVPAATADPCDAVASLPDDGECRGAPLCSARTRVKLVCDVRDAMERRYVFYPIKDRMLGRRGVRFDSRRHLDACVAGERAIAREDDPLRFYDRVRRCMAAFEDGHLLVGAPARLPQVALGIGLALVDGHVYIANRERKLVSYLRAVSGVRDLEDILSVGNEVLEIDGRPVADALREMALYLPASSDAARLERAVDALTRRDFLFPARRMATLTVAVDGGPRVVELPWWISPDAETHVMTRAYLRRTGLATTDLLAWRYDQAKDTWGRDAGSAHGHMRTDPILPPQDASILREYLDEQDRPAVRLGEVVRGRDRAFCYLQILTFHTETLGAGGTRSAFPDVVEGFVRECKDKDLDLVLDLRQNEGGYLSYTNALLSMLTPRGASYPGGALLLRASTQNQLVYQERTPALGAAPARPADDALEPRRMVEAIGAARRAHADFTPAFLERPVHPAAGIGGFRGKVVALTTASCASACDRLVALLHRTGRAVVVGTPTEGAGGSQQEARNLGARWTDPDGLLSVSIPNAAFGVLPRGGDARGSERSADEFFAALAIENHPVRPDVTYATRVEDITSSNRGWLKQVDEVLFPAPAAAGDGGRGVRPDSR